jgi:hypothetical protein
MRVWSEVFIASNGMIETLEEYGIVTSTKHLKRLEKHTGFGKIRDNRTVALKAKERTQHLVL